MSELKWFEFAAVEKAEEITATAREISKSMFEALEEEHKTNPDAPIFDPEFSDWLIEMEQEAGDGPEGIKLEVDEEFMGKLERGEHLNEDFLRILD